MTSQTTNLEFRVMADSIGQIIRPKLHKTDEIINQKHVIEEGNPTRYYLTLNTESCDEQYRKMTFGERDKNKPHKSILLVGETGTGKTTLINVMINYMLGVKREDKVWFEITDDQSDRTSAHSQTSSVTVYGFYPQESPIHLTIIDTPGYGNTCGIEKDKEIAMSLLSLCKSEEMFHEILVVCLVIKATQSRLSDKQMYILDAVQSLFGNNIAENIVLLFTHARGAIPKNVLTAVKEAKIKCAVNDKNQPVYFMFDNCQSDAADEGEMMLEQSWDLSFKGLTRFYEFLEVIKSKTLKMTRDVLKQRRQLDENISKLQLLSQKMVQMQDDLKQTQEALEQKKEYVQDNANFEVDVPSEVKIKIDSPVAKDEMYCNVCEENCHYQRYWWMPGISWSSMLKARHCTECPKKCPYKEHTKGVIYKSDTKTEKRTNEALKKEFYDQIENGESAVKKLEEKLQKLEKDQLKLLIDTFHCVSALEMIALNTDSVRTLLHIDILIEKLKEIKEPDKAKILENIKKRAGEEKNKVLEYIKKMCSEN